MSTQFKLRRDTAANWTAANPTLADGEPGFENDTNKLKLGNGVTPWNSLPYFPGTIDASNITNQSNLNAGMINGSKITVAQTAPTSPATGDLWFW